MEGLPRLPLISFLLKESVSSTNFESFIKKNIALGYADDPDSYIREIGELNSLRAVATRPSVSVDSLTCLKRYLFQLQSLQSRFPALNDRQVADLKFKWREVHSSSQCECHDPQYEMAAVMYNIAAVHSLLGAAESRESADGMKISCTHFQCAAGAFDYICEKYTLPGVIDVNGSIMRFCSLVCLAQAQQCILEKSVMDNRRGLITAKLALQVSQYFQEAHKCLEATIKSGEFPCENVGDTFFIQWVHHLDIKIPLYECLSLLYRGIDAEHQKRMGERITLFEAADSKLKSVKAPLKRLPDTEKQIFQDCVTFIVDVLSAKLTNAKKENDFIYHEKIPALDTLSAFNGASLVKCIPVDFQDRSLVGVEIFHRLIPMKAHEMSSVFSSKKDELLRDIQSKLDKKDEELMIFMSTLQLEQLKIVVPILSSDVATSTLRIPQELVDAMAALQARVDDIGRLETIMAQLETMSRDIGETLDQLDSLLQSEKQSEREYLTSVSLSSGSSAAPLSRLTVKCEQEATHLRDLWRRARESDQSLSAVVATVLPDLRRLAPAGQGAPGSDLGPDSALRQLASSLPSPSHVFNEEDGTHTANAFRLKRIADKVEEMKSQRATLISSLRNAVQKDDITGALASCAADSVHANTVMDKQLEKHRNAVAIIEQNLLAQDNILRALTEANAAYAVTRQLVEDAVNQQQSCVHQLVSSSQQLPELLEKAGQGVEFYTGLQKSARKLLTRVRSMCNVQGEDRSSRKAAVGSTTAPSSGTAGNQPRLADYLAAGYRPGDSLAAFSGAAVDKSDAVPSVRPSPLGSECPTAALTGGSGIMCDGAGAVSVSQTVNSTPPRVPAAANSAIEPYLQWFGGGGYTNWISPGATMSRPRPPTMCMSPATPPPPPCSTSSAPTPSVPTPLAAVRPYSPHGGQYLPAAVLQHQWYPPHTMAPCYSMAVAGHGVGSQQHAHGISLNSPTPNVMAGLFASQLPVAGNVAVSGMQPEGVSTAQTEVSGASSCSQAISTAGALSSHAAQQLTERGLVQPGGYTPAGTLPNIANQQVAFPNQQPVIHPFQQTAVYSQQQTPFPQQQQPPTLQQKALNPQQTQFPQHQPPILEHNTVNPQQTPFPRQHQPPTPQHNTVNPQYTSIPQQQPVPNQQNTSQPQKTPFPYQQPVSLQQNTVPPQHTPFPHQQPVSLQQNTVPFQNTPSPHQQPVSLQQNTVPPQQTPFSYQQPVSLQQNTVPPQQQTMFPQRQGTPLQQQGTLLQQQGTLLQQQGTLHQQQGTLLQQRGTPLQQGIPIQQQGTPLQQQCTPLQQQGTHLQQQATPIQQQALILQQQALPSTNQTVLFNQSLPTPSNALQQQQQHPAVLSRPQRFPQQTVPVTGSETLKSGSGPMFPFLQQKLNPVATSQHRLISPNQPLHQNMMATSQQQPLHQNMMATSQQQPIHQVTSQQQPLQQNMMATSQQQPLHHNLMATSQQQPLQQNMMATSQQQPLQQNMMATSQQQPLQQNMMATSQQQPLHQNMMATSQQQPIHQVTSQQQPLHRSMMATSQQQPLHQIILATSHQQPLHQVTSQQQALHQSMMTNSQQQPLHQSMIATSQQQPLHQNMMATSQQQPLHQNMIATSQQQPLHQNMIAASQQQHQLDQQYHSQNQLQSASQQPPASGQYHHTADQQSATQPHHQLYQRYQPDASSLSLSQSTPTSHSNVEVLQPQPVSTVGSQMMHSDGVTSANDVIKQTSIDVASVVSQDSTQRQRVEEWRQLMCSGSLLTNRDKLNALKQDTEEFSLYVRTVLEDTAALEESWKRLLDRQELQSASYTVAVARCYPMKNRQHDSLPFDSSLVAVPLVRDDYINACRLPALLMLDEHQCDGGSTYRQVAVPPLITTQLPLASTRVDFWCMVWCHRVELVACLLSNQQLASQDEYWPSDKSVVLQFGPLDVSLQSCTVRQCGGVTGADGVVSRGSGLAHVSAGSTPLSFYTERIVSMCHRDTHRSRIVIILQPCLQTASPAQEIEEERSAHLAQFAAQVLCYYGQQKSAMSPVLLHCLTGVGETGVFSALIAAIVRVLCGLRLSVAHVETIVAQLNTARRNALAGSSGLALLCQSILQYCLQLLSECNVDITDSVLSPGSFLTSSTDSAPNPVVNEQKAPSSVSDDLAAQLASLTASDFGNVTGVPSSCSLSASEHRLESPPDSAPTNQHTASQLSTNQSATNHLLTNQSAASQFATNQIATGQSSTNHSSASPLLTNQDAFSSRDVNEAPPTEYPLLPVDSDPLNSLDALWSLRK